METINTNADELVAALEMAHSYLCVKSIDGDNEGEWLRKHIAATIRKVREQA